MKRTLDGVGDRQRTNAEWVLLFYRLPRVPSTPRSAVWRTLKRLGVAQLGDGLVALPNDPRTREALEWIAEDVVDHGGQASVWLGRPADRAGLTALTTRMSAAVGAEYNAIIAEAAAAMEADVSTRRRVAARLSRELRQISDRDFFPPPQREGAERAVADLVGDDSRRPAGATMRR